MTAPARFLEADLKRAVSAVAKAGIRDARIEIMIDGTIAIVMGSAAKVPAKGNSWDKLVD